MMTMMKKTMAMTTTTMIMLWMTMVMRKVMPKAVRMLAAHAGWEDLLAPSKI